jgi:hypothetical protein
VFVVINAVPWAAVRLAIPVTLSEALFGCEDTKPTPVADLMFVSTLQQPKWLAELTTTPVAATLAVTGNGTVIRAAVVV